MAPPEEIAVGFASISDLPMRMRSTLSLKGARCLNLDAVQASQVSSPEFGDKARVYACSDVALAYYVEHLRRDRAREVERGPSMIAER